MSITRRQALCALAAGTGAASLPDAAQAQPVPAKPAAAGLISSGVCVLTPESSEGPFYFDPKLERVDITDGRPGVPLRLLLQIVRAGDCTPIAGARLDVWHSDAIGQYSGYAGPGYRQNVSTPGQRFLRGTQFSDASGLARFTTIYPGWYPGRTPHVHFKVILGDRTALTGQFYFPDALSEFIFRSAAPYNSRRGERDTSNANDGVLHFEGGGREAFCAVKEEADHYLASLVIGVRDGVSQSRPQRPGSRRFPEGRPLPRQRGSLIPGVKS
jgi:protocatechuate 3,4-dioxygenase beta subunit